MHRVASTNSVSPTLRIQGSPNRKLKSMQELKVSASGFVAGCGGVEINTNLVFSWAVYQLCSNGSKVPENHLGSTSADIRTYRLPPFSLSVGSTYVFRCILYSTEHKTSSSASVVVEVIMGNIIAKIAGGAARSVTINDTISLDASPSYDEDSTPSRPTRLEYIWRCVTIRPSYSQSCGFLANRTSYLPVSQLQLLAFKEDTTSRVTVRVYDPITSRSAQASVDLTVVSDAASDVDVDNSYINIDRKVQFTGRIKTAAGGAASWLIDDPSIDLTSRSLTPTFIEVSDEEVLARGKRINFGFALAGFSLMEGLKYTFSMLFVPTLGKPVRSSVSIATNGGPRPGLFATDLSHGTMLETVFAYFASRWSDEDLPLSYAFSYTTDFLSYFTMQSRAEVSFGKAFMPRGLKRLNNRVRLQVQVFDALLASTFATSDIVVDKAKASEDVDKMWELLIIANNDREDKDSLQWSLGIGTSILNGANCSAAPNCTEFNRFPCSVVENTCGLCLSNALFGEAGYSNSMCVPVIAEETHLNSQSGVLKRCMNDCSNNGDCVFYSIVDGVTLNVTSCQITDDFCTPHCICYDGFLGQACSYEPSILVSKQQYRVKSLEQMAKLLGQVDFDAQSA